MSGQQISRAATVRIAQLVVAEIDQRGVEVTAHRAGTPSRSFRRLLSGEVDRLTFTLADNIMTGLFGADIWHTDEVLSDWYQNGEPVTEAVLKNPGRRHQTRCKTCKCHPDLFTQGCQTCKWRAKKRRQLERLAFA